MTFRKFRDYFMIALVHFFVAIALHLFYFPANLAAGVFPV